MRPAGGHRDCCIRRLETSGNPVFADTLNGFLGGAAGSRTPDLFDANEARYQLRYSPKCVVQPIRSGTTADQSLTAQRRSRISSSSVGGSSTTGAISSVASESYAAAAGDGAGGFSV